MIICHCYNKILIVGNTYARCSICGTDISTSHGGRNDVAKHIGTTKHKDMAAALSSSRTVSTFFRAQSSPKVIEAEAHSALFVAKHNLSFLSSEHAAKLFGKMFSDSEIAKSFSCGCTKCAALVTNALAPHFRKKLVDDMSPYPFSIMIDESNASTDKSCIILVRILRSSKTYKI